MSAGGVARRAALSCLLLLAACRGRTEVTPGAGSSLCEGIAPLTLTPVQTRIRVGQAVTLVARGGSGQYAFGVAPGGSGGQVSGDRFTAGATPAKDQVFVNDVSCGGAATARVEVVPAFEVTPTRAVIQPGTTFRIATAGLIGYPQFTLVQNGSNATLDALGNYTAGPNEGEDLIQVLDTQAGDQTQLQFQVSKSAHFRASPARLALATGSWVPLTTADGTNQVAWRLVSGPGTLDGARLSVPPGASGTVQLEARDVFTGQVAPLKVRVLDELTRSTFPHGRLSDVAAVVSADFDGDGIADLAVGFAESDLSRPQGGAVFIFKGSAAGLPATPTWTLTGSSDTAQFGAALAAGDLNGDGIADLAVGAPGADVIVADSGAVYLYSFDASGPHPLRGPLTDLGRGNFGSSIAIADADGDGNPDLWVGSPFGDLANPSDRRGAVSIFFIPRGGPVGDYASFRLSGMDLNPDGTATSRANTNAGKSLVAADLNGDGQVDLAVLGQVSNSDLGGTPLTKTQPAVAVHLNRGGSQPFASTPDAFVLPTNLADTSEGTWRLGFVPAGQGRPPLLMAVADNADSPDLSASGGTRSGTNAGGALLFDLSSLSATSAPGPSPTELGLTSAFARFYGDTASISAGRSFALVDVDGNPGPELLLGAPYASPTPPGKTTSLRLAGRVLAYPLSGLTPGTVMNKPLMDLPGSNPADCLGAGLAPWPLPGGAGLAAVASRASTPLGAFTGRVDAFAYGSGPLNTWTRSSAPFPTRSGEEQFGVAVAAGWSGAQRPMALIGSPGFSGPGYYNDGNDVFAGRALLYDVTHPAAPGVAAQGGAVPLLAGGRSLASGVAFTDFDGDGRQDLIIGAPGLQVPSTATQSTDLTPNYAIVRSACIGSAVQSVGGVEVHLAQADGTFKPAYRLWGVVDIPGCSAPGTTPCQRSGIGRGVAGGFDFDGDGRQDVAAIRNNGLEIFLGRPPDDPQLAKLTMGCDPVYTAPYRVQPTSAPAAVGDLDGDGCDEVAYRAADTTRSSLIIVFGFDPSGARCGGHTVPATVRIADRDANLNFLGLGVSTVRAGNFLGDGRRFIATGVSLFPLNGVTQSAVVLYDAAQIAARRPASGEVVVGALADLTPLPVAPNGPPVPGFGKALAGNVDLDGDGLPDLLVGAQLSSFAGDGTGAVYALSGAKGIAGGVEPFLVLTGDAGERSAFGSGLSLAPGGGGGGPFLVIGAPSSYRAGTLNGTAYSLPLGF